jgi:hypothetical protein
VAGYPQASPATIQPFGERRIGQEKNMTRLAIVLAIMCLVATAQAEEPVLTVDTERIIALAREAIAEQKKDLDLDALDFADITYHCNAERKDHLRVGFRHSPKSKTETTEEDARTSTRTVTKFKAVIVNMDKTGKVLSVDGGGTSSRIEIKSTSKKTVQPQD